MIRINKYLNMRGGEEDEEEKRKKNLLTKIWKN